MKNSVVKMSYDKQNIHNARKHKSSFKKNNRSCISL
jgi:hypothetical protein